MRDRPRRRLGREGAAALLVAAVVVAAGIGLGRISRLAAIGAGFAAKQGCSCVFVAGRSLADCRADMPPPMREVAAERLPDRRAVRAWVPLLAERTARYHEGAGCSLE